MLCDPYPSKESPFALTSCWLYVDTARVDRVSLPFFLVPCFSPVVIYRERVYANRI